MWAPYCNLPGHEEKSAGIAGDMSLNNQAKKLSCAMPFELSSVTLCRG
jgi:hypothetical protein